MAPSGSIVPEWVYNDIQAILQGANVTLPWNLKSAFMPLGMEMS